MSLPPRYLSESSRSPLHKS
ncbi:hypothetical protein E2C01_070862 [Portunus trituberculatus]|uniref:Uncharacterized protein n=1 Tax=Portunus trituberculatus TaxID=210409 RepID=A0A5B7HTV6_PORTR|nr:hypothetical protein [Portunus trituberculatus]